MSRLTSPIEVIIIILMICSDCLMKERLAKIGDSVFEKLMGRGEAFEEIANIDKFEGEKNWVC